MGLGGERFPGFIWFFEFLKGVTGSIGGCLVLNERD